MRLIVVRHGETIENKNNICQGQIEGTLSKLGIKQAKKLALRLKNEKFDSIYSSDLGRAVNTSKEIMKYHSDLKLKLDKRLRERYMGKWQGKPFGKLEDVSKDSETDEEMYNRVKDFLDEIYQKHKGETVLVVSHGGAKMMFLLLAHNKPISDYMSFFGLKNTSVSIFDIKENGNHKIHLENCTKHLEN